MENRSAVQTLWRAARDGLARLNQLLGEADPADGSVFAAKPYESELSRDAAKRIAEARQARMRNDERRPPA